MLPIADDLLNKIASPFLVIDDTGIITSCNQAFCEYFNITDNVAGKSLVDVVRHPDLMRLIAKEETRGEIYLPEFERFINVELAHQTGQGSVVIMQDITHLKARERLRSSLISDISRNLRSPLTAIVGYAELLVRMGDLSEQQQNFVQRIILSVDSMKRLINDLTELEKVESGIDATIQEVDMRIIVRYSVDGFHEIMSRKSQHLNLELPDKCPAIYGNPIRLRQLINNLLQNAILYTPDNGALTIKLWDENDVVSLSIIDNGMGINPDEQVHIFDKFYRGSNVLELGTRSGLGLAIAQNIVGQHGGRIWVESALNQGSTFTVMLPCDPKKPLASKSAS